MWHYVYGMKEAAPEDGQKFARNMLSLTWRSVKLLLLHLVGFYITLPIYKYYLEKRQISIS